MSDYILNRWCTDLETKLVKANDEIKRLQGELAILQVADNAEGYNEIIAFHEKEITRLRDAHQEIIEVLKLASDDWITVQVREISVKVLGVNE
jgi:hypothetical protein